MSVVLDAFKIKPYDFDALFAAWPDAPRFEGKPKKDMPVDEWLAAIKAGCLERKVPKEQWHRVAQHYMGDKARARFEEVKKVMQTVHGGAYRWNWKNFKVAMRNMGWDIDPQKTESVKVESKPSGMWWIVGRGGSSDDKKEPEPAPAVPLKPKAPERKNTWDVSRFRQGIPMPKRAATTSFIERTPSTSSDSAPSSSSKGWLSNFTSSPASTPALTSASTSVASTPASTPGDTVTTIANVPAWLLNACQSLEFLTTEHPKVMTAVSAVLITVGSLPALPAISAGAGGAFLASTTAHALGSIAVGLGTILKAQAEGSVHVANGEVVKK